MPIGSNIEEIHFCISCECSIGFDPNPEYLVEDELVCWSCFNEAVQCEVCNKYFWEENIAKVEETNLNMCDECYNLYVP